MIILVQQEIITLLGTELIMVWKIDHQLLNMLVKITCQILKQGFHKGTHKC